MENVTSASIDDEIKISSLECLGLTCARLPETLPMSTSPEIFPETTDRILTTIVDGIRANRPNPIRFAAAKALGNSLYLARKNMETPVERNMIFQTICEATQSEDPLVREAAYECIVKIADIYYDKLQDYMQTLFQLTFATIRNDQEDAKVALQAIEFWSTLAEVEQELIVLANDLAERGESPPPERVCVGYVKGALEHLCPLLMEILTKQDENAELEDDLWNLCVNGAICLGLVAGIVEDAIVAPIMPFVQQHIRSENWRYREAAIMAFCSILIGPSDEAIGHFVSESIPVLLEALSDSNDLVKDTTVLTIGQICEYRVGYIPPETFPNLVTGLAGKLLLESPRISSFACNGIRNLAMALKNDGSAATTNPLSRKLCLCVIMFLSFLTSHTDLPFCSIHGTALSKSTTSGGPGGYLEIKSSHSRMWGD